MNHTTVPTSQPADLRPAAPPLQSGEPDCRTHLCLTAESAARILETDPQWLRRQRAQGRGPSYFKVAGRVLYRALDLAEYRNNCTIPTGAARRIGA